jgi:dipeptidyl aminopeptidase/acylaminoacyl peptidase
MRAPCAPPAIIKGSPEVPMRVPALLAATTLSLLAQRPMQVDDLFKVKRVADPQVSSVGDLAYQVGSVDLEANKVVTKLWIRWAKKNNGMTGIGFPLELGEGGQSRPRFSPDGGSIAYLKGGQVWVVDLESNQTRQVTKVTGGVSGHQWSPDGKWIAFLATTVPSGDPAENEAYLKAQEASKVKARHITSLMYRHWDEWKDPKQVSHLFIQKVDGSEAPRDLTKGFTTDVPHFSDVAAGDGFAWAPDGQKICFESHPEQTKGFSTNGELYEVSLADGAVKKLTTNPAMDTTPRYSPDGKYLAWRAQRRPGFESDKFELWVMDRATGKVVADTRHIDMGAGSFAWDGGALVFAGDAAAHTDLYRWDPFAKKKGKPARITTGLHVEGFAQSGDKFLLTSSDTATPPEVYEVVTKEGKARPLTRHNVGLAADLKLNRAEDLWFEGGRDANGKPSKVHALIIKPQGWTKEKTWPVAFLIHGGPQGAWMDSWGHRWNPQAWAGRGFVVVMVNPRGSTGYGQAFCDAISGDWNGTVMVDLMKGLEASLKAVHGDPKRVIAAGGSYGGYAVNWLAGHYSDKFAAFVSHAGIYNVESMQVATEEMWFPRWEFKGFPWESKKAAALWRSSSPHANAGLFKKPMLVVHGEQDFRVVVTEGLQLFHAHQLRGIPSELLYFPDEGHWILKPQNSQLWYNTVLGWCERWTK